MKTKRSFCKGFIVCVSFLLLFLIPHFSFGATFCVSDATNLQSALTTAQSNSEDDTIQIVQGTYNENFTYAATEANSLTMEGGYTSGCSARVTDPANTILDGGGADHVLALVRQAGAADFSVKGLTFQNGNATTVSEGGGLYVRTEGVATLTSNTFTENTAHDCGGGVYVDGESALTNNTFIKNTSYCGGGAYVGPNSTLINNTFTENIGSSSSGGGSAAGASVGSNSTLINNLFTENTAHDYAGAFVGAESTLTNNTFTKNKSNNVCGGVYVGPNSTLTNNTFTGNTTSIYGGGASIDSNCTLTNNTFTDNIVTDYGGGAYVSSNCTLTNNLFIKNTAMYGGGAYLVGGGTNSYATLTNNTFTENTAKYGGGVGFGGITTTYTLTNNTFSGNTATTDGGGAWMNCVYPIILTNNIFTGNTASNNGGGTWVKGCGGLNTLTNNTFTGNTANNSGGGIWFGFDYDDSIGKLYNNITWNNTAPKGADLYINNVVSDPFFPVQVDVYNNDFDQSTSGTYIKIPFAMDPSNLNNATPLFVRSDNYHLSSSSPCLNKGKNDAPSIPATDKDGEPRISGGTVDMGAYEYNSSAPIANAGPDQTVIQGATVTLDGSTSNDPGSQTLTYLWTQIGATTVTLSDAASAQPTFATSEIGSDGASLIFKLTVANTSGLKNTDIVGINVVKTPTVTTTAISLITTTNASTGGNVTSDGGYSVTARGVCWSTSVNPTITNSKTTDGAGTGSFTSSITGLSPNTTYYVRAYATNSSGTAYGYNQSFTTSGTSLPVPDIKANNSDGPITVSPSDLVSIDISLDPGDKAGQDADWWLVESTPSDTFNYYNLSTGSMVPGLLPTHQGPLFNLGTTQLLNSSDLTVGTHTFYFGVDLNMNGSLDMDSIYYDSVNVIVQ